MTYRQGFDHLGNQVPPPKADWQHKTIQVVGWATVAACILMLAWVR